MRHGQLNGTVRQEIDPDACAAFVVGSIEGCMGMAKASQEAGTMRLAMLGLAQFLEAMRPTHSIQ